MRISEMLQAIASWLESNENEALLLAEYDDKCLKIVAEANVLAAGVLKAAAEQVESIEPLPESLITPESVMEIANLATALDSSEDPNLKKQASVLDELLLTIAAPPNVLAEKKAAEDKRLEDLRKVYEEPKKTLNEMNKVSEAEKEIEKSKLAKDYVRHDHPLNTRTCPDHPGAQLARISENVYQCDLDKKSYDYRNGYKLNDGTQVPGGDVSLQTQNYGSVPMHAIFDSRNGRQQTNKP